jgi:hypothetical protein
MERFFVSRDEYDYPNMPISKWHLFGFEKWVGNPEGDDMLYMYSACGRLRIDRYDAEWVYMDVQKPEDLEGQPPICKWCLKIARNLDAAGVTDDEWRSSRTPSEN